MCPGSPEASGLEVPRNPLKRVGFLFTNLQWTIFYTYYIQIQVLNIMLAKRMMFNKESFPIIITATRIHFLKLQMTGR